MQQERLALSERCERSPPLVYLACVLEQVDTEQPKRPMPQRRILSLLKETRQILPMVDEDSKASPVTIEIVRKRDSVTRNLNAQLVRYKRLKRSKLADSEGINRDRCMQFVCLALRQLSRKSTARYTVDTAIDFRAPEPFRHAGLTDR